MGFTAFAGVLRRASAVALIAAFAATAHAGVTADVVQITTDSSDQFNPAIFGDTIAYEHVSGGTNYGIYTYSIVGGSATSITGGNANFHPAVSGSAVVWEKAISGDTHIFSSPLFTSGTGQQTFAVGDDQNPAISGTKVLYTHIAPGETSLQQLELTTGVITEVAAVGFYPDIEGSRAVWQGSSGGGTIYFDDLSEATTAQALTLTGISQASRARISGDYVVFQGIFGAETDTEIFAYDLTDDSIIRITDNTANDVSPDIDREGVVWRTTLEDIRFHFLPTSETIVLQTGTGLGDPRIENFRAVWTGQGGEGLSTSDREVWLATVTIPEPATLAALALAALAVRRRQR